MSLLQANGALQNRDRYGHRLWDGPGSALQHDVIDVVLQCARDTHIICIGYFLRAIGVCSATIPNWRLRLMSTLGPIRAVCAFAAALAVFSVLGIASQSTAQSPPWLTGQLLVASPDMGDPRFERTVILMVRHDREGAFGLVINRPVREAPLPSL